MGCDKNTNQATVENDLCRGKDEKVRQMTPLTFDTKNIEAEEEIMRNTGRFEIEKKQDLNEIVSIKLFGDIDDL